EGDAAEELGVAGRRRPAHAVLDHLSEDFGVDEVDGSERRRVAFRRGGGTVAAGGGSGRRGQLGGRGDAVPDGGAAFRRLGGAAVGALGLRIGDLVAGKGADTGSEYADQEKDRGTHRR